jgi:hypothetical protein
VFGGEESAASFKSGEGFGGQGGSPSWRFYTFMVAIGWAARFGDSGPRRLPSGPGLRRSQRVSVEN